MIGHIVGTAVGLTLGFYAGKKRAAGMDWGDIACGLWNDTVCAVKNTWDAICAPFGDDGESASDQESALDEEDAGFEGIKS